MVIFWHYTSRAYSQIRNLEFQIRKIPNPESRASNKKNPEPESVFEVRKIRNTEFQIREIPNPGKPIETLLLLKIEKKGSVQRSKKGLFTFYDNLHRIIAFERSVITHQNPIIVLIVVMDDLRKYFKTAQLIGLPVTIKYTTDTKH